MEFVDQEHSEYYRKEDIVRLYAGQCSSTVLGGAGQLSLGLPLVTGSTKDERWNTLKIKLNSTLRTFHKDTLHLLAMTESMQQGANPVDEAPQRFINDKAAAHTFPSKLCS